MAELLGIERLRDKLAAKSVGVRLRYNYYDMHIVAKDFNRDLPPEFTWMRSVLGWCAKAVDTLADRLVFRDFENDNFDMMEIYRLNNPDILTDSAILAALIGSCSFIYIAFDPDQEDDFPKMRVIDGMSATGVIDPVTYTLTEGYAILERDIKGRPVWEAYFVPGRTDYYLNGQLERSVVNVAPFSLLVPMIYRPDATRAFGHSRVSRACMDLTHEAMRTLRRSNIAAEFYSYPQRYVLGLSQDAEQFNTWRAAMSAFLRIDRDEDGNLPQVGQFAQQSMTPYTDQIRMIAGLFAGETGLTLDDLGLPSQNPSSADAIKASHETLRLTARKAQRTFGTGLINAGFVAACLRDNERYLRREVYNTRALWEPIFEPDASQLSGLGDAVIKIQQAFPDYFDERKLRELTGI